jgi:hypothetical protein
MGEDFVNTVMEVITPQKLSIEQELTSQEKFHITNFVKYVQVKYIE